MSADATSSPPSLPQRMRIDLWTWRLDRPDAALATASELLSAEETARAAKFVHARDSKRFVAGRARMREILSGYLCVAPAQLDLQADAFKKPFVPTRAGEPPLHFNLAHCQDFAVLAVSRDAPVGVDVELIRPITEHAERYFSKAEQTALATLSGDAWWRGFYQCWTRKEAFVKALGRGLLIPLEDFDVTLIPGEPARLLRYENEPHAPQRWELRHLEFHSGFIGALAMPSGGAALDVVKRDDAPHAG